MLKKTTSSLVESRPLSAQTRFAGVALLAPRRVLNTCA